MLNTYQNIEYVEKYSRLYINHPFWKSKYECNKNIFRKLLPSLDPPIWLDLFCGQGQYFEIANNKSEIECIGIDTSKEQLQKALERNNEKVYFICADIMNIHLDEVLDRVGLVSLMWGAYSYLPNSYSIIRLLIQIIKVLDKQGKFLIEIIEPSTLKSFNKTSFAKTMNAHVKKVRKSNNGITWEYDDDSDIHSLFCPTLSWFMKSLQNIGFMPYHIVTVQTIHQVLAIKK